MAMVSRKGKDPPLLKQQKKSPIALFKFYDIREESCLKVKEDKN